MLNTSSSEDEDYVGSTGNYVDDDQARTWLNCEGRNIDTIDLISKPQVSTLMNSGSLPLNDKFNLKYASTNQSPATSWKGMQYNTVSDVRSPFKNAQRPPRLSDWVAKNTNSPKIDLTPSTEIISQDPTVPVTTSTQFSVSFESPLEACPLGTRLSPVGVVVGHLNNISHQI
ncbi:unnamed protein product [Heterobilharzia americana]|nr:unnamed protein product [Heterobilharzia americana]